MAQFIGKSFYNTVLKYSFFSSFSYSFDGKEFQSFEEK